MNIVIILILCRLKNVTLHYIGFTINSLKVVSSVILFVVGRPSWLHSLSCAKLDEHKLIKTPTFLNSWNWFFALNWIIPSISNKYYLTIFLKSLGTYYRSHSYICMPLLSSCSCSKHHLPTRQQLHIHCEWVQPCNVHMLSFWPPGACSQLVSKWCAIQLWPDSGYAQWTHNRALFHWWRRHVPRQSQLDLK